MTQPDASFAVELGSTAALTVQAVWGDHRSPAITVEASDARQPLALVLPRVPAIRGRVCTPTGHGAAGWVSVWHRERGSPRWSPRRGGHVTADRTGGFHLDLPSGAYALSGFATGFAPSEPQQVDVTDARPGVEVELRLRAGGEIRGAVVDDEGRPVARVTLFLARETTELGGRADDPLPYALPTAQLGSTGDDGSFAFTGLIPTAVYRLACVPRVSGLDTAKHGGLRPGDHDLRIVVPARDLRTGTLSGTVHAADGTLLTGFDITAGRDWRRVDAPDGRFALDGVPLGRPTRVLVREYGQQVAQLAGTCTVEREHEHVELRLAPPGALEILVREADGTRAAGVEVTLRSELDDTATTVRARDDGVVLLPVLHQGRYAVHVERRGGGRLTAATVDVRPGTAERVELRAERQ